MFLKVKPLYRLYTVLLFLWLSWVSMPLSAQIQVSVDTTHIRIGEQFYYTITAEQSTNAVFSDFKKDVSGKIEVLKSVPVDTLKNRLYKKYILTSFDSGAYYIPAQEVLIDQKRVLTDSLLLHVGTVQVDTTKQGLFPLKPIFKAPPKTWHEYLWMVWWAMAILFFGLLIWWLAFRKKSFAFITQKKPLTPYETAIEELKKLDAQQFLVQQKIKEYYTALTDIIRKYMETDMNISAMETTSDELILMVKKENIHKKLGLTHQHISQLQAFLRHSDLVKFAKAKPELGKMQDDKKYTVQVLQDLNQVVSDYETRIQAQPNTANTGIKTTTPNRKRKLWILGVGLFVLLLTIGGVVWYYGLQYAKDTIVGHPSKELLEGKWYKTSYGYPSVTLESPVILKPIPQQNAGMVYQSQALFEYHSLMDHFKINVTTLSFHENIPIDLSQATEMAKANIGKIPGVHQLKMKSEEITVSGMSGVKIVGTFDVENIPVQITNLLFLNGKNLVDISVMRKQKDAYAEQIENRIVSSIQIENISD